MRFEGKVFKAFDDDLDLSEFLSNLIEKESEPGRESREWINNFIKESTDKRVRLDLCEHINSLMVVSQDIALSVGYILGHDFSLDKEEGEALEEIETIRGKLKTSGVYDRILGIFQPEQKISAIEKYLSVLEELAEEKKNLS